MVQINGILILILILINDHSWGNLWVRTPILRSKTTVSSFVYLFSRWGICFYIVHYPVHWTAQSTLPSPGRPVHSGTNSTSLVNILATQAHAAIMCEDTHISTIVYSQVLIYTTEWTGTSWREQQCPSFETVTRGFEPRLSRLRARHSTAELSCCTTHMKIWRRKICAINVSSAILEEPCLHLVPISHPSISIPSIPL